MSAAFDRAAPHAACTRRIFQGADVDEYRARYGKAEGERRFFAEHHAAAADVLALQDAAEIDDGPRFEFDEIGPFDSVYIDTSRFA